MQYPLRWISGIAFASIGLYWIYSSWYTDSSRQSPDPSSQLTYTVKGNSMYPLYQDGQEIRATTSTEDVDAGDDIIFDFAGDKNNLIIKKIVGTPGDHFSYSGGQIFINNTIIKNSEGVPYNIQSKILELYAHEYPILPPKSYLILGNISTGSLDGSRIGLVSANDIVAKVVKD